MWSAVTEVDKKKQGNLIALRVLRYNVNRLNLINITFKGHLMIGSGGAVWNLFLPIFFWNTNSS